MYDPINCRTWLASDGGGSVDIMDYLVEKLEGRRSIHGTTKILIKATALTAIAASKNNGKM